MIATAIGQNSNALNYEVHASFQNKSCSMPVFHLSHPTTSLVTVATVCSSLFEMWWLSCFCGVQCFASELSSFAIISREDRAVRSDLLCLSASVFANSLDPDQGRQNDWSDDCFAI